MSVHAHRLLLPLLAALSLESALSLRSHAAPPAPQPQAQSEPCRDRYGDPLPPGAIARLGTLRFRVDAEIEGMAFAPDGQSMAVRGNGGIWLLDAVSGKQIRHIDASGALTPHIAFSPDGKRLIAACHVSEKDRVRPVNHLRHIVRVWETASGRKVIESELQNARWVGWSADGQPLAAYLAKGEIRLRDVASCRERRFPAKDLPDPVQSAICSCAGAQNILAASDENRLVHVWNLTSGKEQCVVKTSGQSVRGLALAPNGRRLASLTQDAAGAYSVRVWDTATGQGVHRVAAEQKYIDEVVFSPDSKMLATVGAQEILLWSSASGRELRRIPSVAWESQRIAISPDGQTLATAVRNSGASRAIHLWNVADATRKPQAEGHSGWPGRPAFSPDGARVATDAEGTIRIWNSATGELLLRIHRGEGMRHGVFSADGRTLFSCKGNELLFLDAATGRESRILKVEDPDRPKARQSALSLHLSADGARLIVLSSDDGHREMLVTGWDAATGKQLFRRRRTNNWRVVSADAQMLIAPYPALDDRNRERSRLFDKSYQPRLRQEKIATGEPLLTFPHLEGQTLALTFSPDGRLFVSNTIGPLSSSPTGWGETLRLWEVLTAGEVLTMPVAANLGFIKAAFSANGLLLALSAPSTEILLWDVKRGKELRRFKDFDAQVVSLAFAPDGRRLVSGLSNSTLLVWDAGTIPVEVNEKRGAEGVAKAWADLAATDSPRLPRTLDLSIRTGGSDPLVAETFASRQRGRSATAPPAARGFGERAIPRA